MYSLIEINVDGGAHLGYWDFETGKIEAARRLDAASKSGSLVQYILSVDGRTMWRSKTSIS